MKGIEEQPERADVREMCIRDREGDIPWVWLCNVDHLYYVRDGLQIAEQKIHPHGHGWSLVNNVDQWSYVTP